MKVATVAGNNNEAKVADAMTSLVDGEAVVSKWNFNKQGAHAILDPVKPTRPELVVFFRPAVNERKQLRNQIKIAESPP